MPKFFRKLLKLVAVIFILANVVVIFHAYKFTHFYDNGTLDSQTKKSSLSIAKSLLFGINAEKRKNILPDTTFETVVFKTKDSISIEGWYTTTKNALGTVCLLHGHGGSKSGTNKEAAAFRKLGYNTLQIDLRAHGGSGGNTCTIGFNEAEELKHAYDFIKSKGEKNIVLWGISMGAATITSAFDKYDDLKPNKVILEMCFASLNDAVSARMKIMNVPPQPATSLLSFWGGTIRGFWAFNYAPCNYAKKINCPTLMQWGKNDPRVSEKEQQLIFNNLATNTKKLVVYDATHESLCKKDPEKWMANIGEFLK
jgi:uncharacterized protein